VGSGRTNECDQGIRRGRLAKADQFAGEARTIVELAAEESDVADTYLTLCVHAGIAASDVICLVPGLMEALNPREDESHGGTEEVPRGASGAGDPDGGRRAAWSGWRSTRGVIR